MIVFVQSYTAPKTMEADNEVYHKVIDRFPNEVKSIGFYGETVRSLTTKESVKQSWGGVLKSKRQDLLFLWGGDLPVFSFLFSKLLLKRRNILGQNLILHKANVEDRWSQKIRYWIYKWALHTQHFHMTVNSQPLVDFYSEWFGCKKDRFFVVYDSMALNATEKKILESRGTRNEFYVFCGGKEQRDIEGFLKVVEMMPDVKFKAVFRKRDMPADYHPLKNLELYHDTTREEFYQIMAGASVCLLPLKSTSPCGLSVAQKAMLMELNIISTETPSMRTLIPNDDYGFLLPMYDYESIAKKIEALRDNKSLCHFQREKALERMRIFSAKNVGKQLCNAIEACYQK
jgi:glycosyltransferase involved in cell wall biosynthesis